jgi:hypothetical protein
MIEYKGTLRLEGNTMYFDLDRGPTILRASNLPSITEKDFYDLNFESKTVSWSVKLLSGEDPGKFYLTGISQSYEIDKSSGEVHSLPFNQCLGAAVSIEKFYLRNLDLILQYSNKKEIALGFVDSKEKNIANFWCKKVNNWLTTLKKIEV